MVTATVEERVQEDNYDVFRHFEGGREGVRSRFGDLIRKGLEKSSFKDVMCLCREIEFDPSNLYEIMKGNYEPLNAKLVENLACACGFDYNQGLGEFLINDEDVPGILERMRKSGFHPIGTPPGGITDKNLCKIYLLYEASNQL